MSKSLDFYFDFISPYSFIAYKEIKKFEKKYSFKIKYRPILLGGLKHPSKTAYSEIGPW